MRARRLVAEGRVQGVGFRWSARREARRLGLTGWVLNRPDGAVLAHVEGPARALAAFEAWFAGGPSGARVDALAADDAEPAGHAEFEVRR